MKKFWVPIMSLVVLVGCQTAIGTRTNSAVSKSTSSFPTSWHEKIDGSYEGFLVSGTQKNRVVSTFRNSSDGKIFGEYVFYENGAPVYGTFPSCKADKKGEMVCNWQDKYGTGILEMKFSKSLNEFRGFWGTSKINTAFFWNGMRRQ